MHPGRLALRRAAQVLSVLMVAVAVWTAWALMTTRGLLEHARVAVAGAAEQEESRAALGLLVAAEDDLRRAEERMSGLGPRIAERVPVLGRTPRAVRLVSEAGHVAVGVSRDVLAVSDDRPLLSEGRMDLAALAALEQSLERAARAVGPSAQRLAAVETAWTPSAVRAGVLDARTETDGLSERLSRAAGGVHVAAGLVGRDGPRRLLLVVQNNAELRGLGGLVTVFAQARTEGGRLEIGAFRDVAEVADTAPDVQRVAAPADYRELWGRYLANSTLWKNTNMSPDGPTASRVLADVAEASLPDPPDAVIWFDVRTIAALLEATGPATLPDGTALTHENAVRVLLSDAYSDARDDSVGQARRRAVLRAAADSIAGRLLDAGTPPARTASALARAAAGRHLVVWSARPQDQERLVAAGAAGDTGADGGDVSSLFVQNLGGGDTEGNKLDYYGRRQVTVRVVVGEDEALVEQRLAVRNTAPPTGLPRYVAGQATPSVSNLLVTATLPRQAELLSFARGGRPLRVEPQPMDGHAAVQDAAAIPPGATTEWTLRYRLPLEEGAYRSTLLPQPLAVDAGLLLEVRAADGLELRVPPGASLDADGALRTSGSYEAVTTVEVTAERPGRARRLLEGLQRFWNEPVPLP